MRSANATSGENDQLNLRIGINLGDIVESGDDLMGDAVNVAVRLESIATTGGICVSSSVYEQITGKLMLGAEDIGDQHVKNIPRPIHAYRLTLDGSKPTPLTPHTRRPRPVRDRASCWSAASSPPWPSPRSGAPSICVRGPPRARRRRPSRPPPHLFPLRPPQPRRSRLLLRRPRPLQRRRLPLPRHPNLARSCQKRCLSFLTSGHGHSKTTPARPTRRHSH